MTNKTDTLDLYHLPPAKNLKPRTDILSAFSIFLAVNKTDDHDVRILTEKKP